MTISEIIPLSAREDWTVERAVAAVSASLKGVRRLGVAFSGGVDSSLLLALATRILGVDGVIALLGVSPSLAAEERSAAHDVAHQVGVRLVEVMTFEGDRPEYQANGPDRRRLRTRRIRVRLKRLLCSATRSTRCPCRHEPRCPATARRLRYDQAGSAHAGPGYGPASGRQTCCAVPRVADSTPPVGNTCQAQPDRAR